MTNKKTLKTIVFSLGLAAMTLTANSLNAQNDGSRGLFGMGASSADNQFGSNGGSMLRQQGDPTEINGNIQNDGFGAPLGSGIVILLGAGLGYVALKKKED